MSSTESTPTDNQESLAQGAPAAAEAPAAEAVPTAAVASSDGSTPSVDDGADGEEDGAGDENAPADASGATGGDAPAKKKRRRRRKKKPAGDGAAVAGQPGAEGAPQAAADNRPKKKKEERERPAFSVGDVVFGKITEIGEDAIFVDLSGKGVGIFDKLELLLPEDHAAEIERLSDKAEIEADAIMTGRDPNAPAVPQDAPTLPEFAETVAAPDDAALMALLGEKREEHRAATPRIITPKLEEATADAAPEGAEAGADAAAAESGESDGAADAAAAVPKTESIIQLPKVVLEPGAAFVAVVHNDGGRGGNVVLTHHPKRGSMAKPALARAFKEGNEIYGLVTGAIKGGVEVDVDGVRAFTPGSHMDLRLGANLHHFVGKRLAFKVTQYGKRGRDVVLSRKDMLEAEAKEAREKALATLKVGEIVEGTVRSVVSFGAFIDLGGVEGLVSLSEMSHNRGDSPSDVFRPKAKTMVKILKIDEKGKIWLSHKATIPDPWASVKEKYPIGSKHKAKVVRIQDFGAFVELESGIDGLIHTIDLAFKRADHAKDVVNIGDELDVVVSHMDAHTHKIGLHPALTGAQAEEPPQKVIPNKSVKAMVVQAEANGLQVRIMGVTGRGARGYIPGSVTGTPKGAELRKLFPVGQVVEAKVLEIDPRRGEVKLSIRGLLQDNEKNAYQAYRQKVKEEAKFGTFGDLLAKRNLVTK